MKIYGFFILLLSLTFNAQAETQQNCIEMQQPQLIRQLENWSIIADNKTEISTAPNFSGPLLTYSLTSKPTQAENTITINPSNGQISIDAQKRDNFDVTVTATNGCGNVSSTFNIQIDEEE